MKKITTSLKNKSSNIKNNFSKAFGIFRNNFKNSSLNYILKLRKKWRNN